VIPLNDRIVPDVAGHDESKIRVRGEPLTGGGLLALTKPQLTNPDFLRNVRAFCDAISTSGRG
jgi:hypothetical protein